MKRFFAILFFTAGIAACKNNAEQAGKFTINGQLKNTADQKIYLEQLSFNDKGAEVLDTAEIKNGKFSVSAVGGEEGFYRLRLEKSDNGYVFVNDATVINFTADINDQSLEGPIFSSKGNMALKSFLTGMNTRRTDYLAAAGKIDALKKTPGSDRAVAAETSKLQALNDAFKQFVLKTLDTTSDAGVAMFVMGYTKDIDTNAVRKTIPVLLKRFPSHKGVADIITSYNEMIARQQQPAPAESQGSAALPQVGGLAPDFTMNDVEGKPFTLSSLRGKYVLVDFWASWCGPCRGENPNVVAAFNKYKNKNFTILGVSLDENKDAWQKAISADNLAWKHVSDLKGWQNATVSLYGFEGIPYNVLLDPQGKIITTELRGEALENKLAEVLK